jgi:cyclophilin family peptidyl-prolyl cis-trans isomerase
MTRHAGILKYFHFHLLPALTQQGVKFHRIVKGFCCQGGDVVKGEQDIPV